MSLLDSWNAEVTVYPEMSWIDQDGNTMVGPAKTGFPAKVRVQHYGQSGTASRRAEMDQVGGFQTEEMYRMRFTRSYNGPELGAQSRIEWNGEYWAVFGNPKHYIGSPRTSYSEYTIVRD